MILSLQHRTDIIFTHHASFWAENSDASSMLDLVVGRAHLPFDGPMSDITTVNEMDLELIW